MTRDLFLQNCEEIVLVIKRKIILFNKFIHTRLNTLNKDLKKQYFLNNIVFLKKNYV